MIKGLRTTIYHVTDLEQAKSWYSELFSVQPYFDQPFYVGFQVGGFELGLDPNSTDVTWGNNAVTYWGVENIKEEVQRAVGLGASLIGGIENVGDEIWVAHITDPFGNTIGLIQNPHFKYLEK